MENIRVKDIMQEMRKPDPFSITFVTYNKKNQTGGDKITLNEAVCIGGPSDRVTAKNPNHADNFTRNIRALHGDKIITVHALYITRFNGKTVSL